MESIVAQHAVTSNNTERFLTELYGDAGDYIATFSGKQDGNNNLIHTRQRFFTNTPEGRREAARYLLSEAAAGRDTYMGAHAFKNPTSRTKGNAADEIRTLWSESDEARPRGGVPEPSITVESSPGHYHDYWTLTRPVPSSKAEELNRRIALAMGSDSGWALSKLLRPPETFNYKRETPAKVSATYTGAAYDPEQLDRVLPPLPTRHHTTGTGDEPPVRLQEAALRVWNGNDPKYKADGGVDKSATLLKIGRVLYDAGANRQTIVPALEERDEALGFHKYTTRPHEYERIMDVLETEGRNGSGRLIVGGGRKSFPLTDLGNAERLAQRYGDNIRYVAEWGRFLVWDGKRWVMDSEEHLRIKHLAKQTVRTIYGEAEKAEQDTERKAIANHAKASESNNRIRGMVDSLKSEPFVAVQVKQLDGDPYLLNVNNGTLNLRTGELQAHKRADLITKIAPVDYHEDATAPTFEAFLREILPSEPVQGFMQRVIGYSLNGTTEEHKLPILHGAGANGKGTLLNTILAVVGDYGMQAANELLMARRNSHTTDLTDLFGKRFVINQETEQGQRLNESLVKQMTGGDRIRARRMRENNWEFQATHTLMLATNHKPVIRGTDNAIWRRLRLVPFTVEIPEHEQDHKLPEKLMAELPGILAWAVRGHMEWQQNGLGEPQEVTRATGDYRSDMDTLSGFIGDTCVVHPNARVKAQALYDAYVEWCDASRESAMKKKEFKEQMVRRGFTHKRARTGAYHYFGLGFEQAPDPEPGKGTVLGGENSTGAPNDEPMNPDEPKMTMNGNNFSHEPSYTKTVHQGSSVHQTHVEDSHGPNGLPAASDTPEPAHNTPERADAGVEDGPSGPGDSPFHPDTVAQVKNALWGYFHERAIRHSEPAALAQTLFNSGRLSYRPTPALVEAARGTHEPR